MYKEHLDSILWECFVNCFKVQSVDNHSHFCFLLCFPGQADRHDLNNSSRYLGQRERCQRGNQRGWPHAIFSLVSFSRSSVLLKGGKAIVRRGHFHNHPTPLPSKKSAGVALKTALNRFKRMQLQITTTLSHFPQGCQSKKFSVVAFKAAMRRWCVWMVNLGSGSKGCRLPPPPNNTKDSIQI